MPTAEELMTTIADQAVQITELRGALDREKSYGAAGLARKDAEWEQRRKEGSEQIARLLKDNEMLRENLAKKAWIVAWVDAAQDPPVILGAGVFSEERPTTTEGGRRCFPLWGFSGKSYVEASEIAMNQLANDTVYGWLGELDKDGNRTIRRTKAFPR